MVAASGQIFGAQEIADSFRQAAGRLGSATEAETASARIVLRTTRAFAPVRTGTLTGTATAGHSGQGGVVTYSARHAIPIEVGSGLGRPRRQGGSNRPYRYVRSGIESSIGQIEQLFSEQIDVAFGF